MEQDLIKSVLGTLTTDDQKQLIYAHQQLHTRYLILSNGRFIGVHCQNIHHLTIEHSYNDWSIGISNSTKQNSKHNKG